MANPRLDWSRLLLYTVSNIITHAPESAGVYRLSYESEGKVFVFYVGQADNLREQLLGHLSDLEPNVCIRRHVQSYTCYFGFASLAKKADRDGAERALYEHFAHECNTAVPQGPAADINFS
jgi:hypothetical protein